MSGLYLYVGGAASGKSAAAERRACGLAESRLYVATLKPADEESEHRVARHRVRRDGSWKTVEAGADLAATLGACPECGVVLVDGLGAWMSAMLCGIHGRATDPEKELAARFQDFLDALEALEECGRPVVVVSEEVGMGLVPADAVSRTFREELGCANQRLAAVAKEVVLVACGLELPLKKSS